MAFAKLKLNPVLTQCGSAYLKLNISGLLFTNANIFNLKWMQNWSLIFLFIFSAIVILFITLRRSKKEPLIISEEDVRENVVTYDDEGGGEEDTEAFDIIALRNPEAAEELKFRRDVRPEGGYLKSARRPCHYECNRHSPTSLETDEDTDVCEFIKQRLAEADQDTSVPPYDSLQTYAYEGQGSLAGSISSLGSLAGIHSEQDYSTLDEWDPGFKKLSELSKEEADTEHEPNTNKPDEHT